MTLKTLSEIFPNVILGEGIFSEMTSVPWSNDITGDELDIMFFSEYGDRPIAPIFKLISIDNTGSITESGRKQIANLLEKRFRVPWKKRYDVLELDYNPLDSMRVESTNSVTENITFTDDTTDTRSIQVSGTNSKTGTDTTNDTVTYDTVNSRQNSGGVTQTVENTGKDTTVQNDSTYGFNSTEAVPTDVSNKTNDTTNSGTSTTTDSSKVEDTKTGTDKSDRTITYDNTDTVNSDTTDTNTRNKDETTDRTLTNQNSKTGSLGVFTNQDILQKELDLWKYDYFKSVFEDVANIICLAIYQVDI